MKETERETRELGGVTEGKGRVSRKQEGSAELSAIARKSKIRTEKWSLALAIKTVSDICKGYFSKMLWTECSDSGVDKRRGSRNSEC